MSEICGKLIVAKGLKKLPKLQKIAQSGHTGNFLQLLTCRRHSLINRHRFLKRQKTNRQQEQQQQCR